MILLDANLLVYAVVAEMPQHDAARRWLEDVLSRPLRVGVPWSSLLAFHRISTSPRVFRRPLTFDRSWRLVEEWMALDDVWIPVPGPGHAVILGGLVRDLGIAGNLTYDAHLAALAIEHGLQLMSTDGDFARFPGLRWSNPLDP